MTTINNLGGFTTSGAKIRHLSLTQQSALNILGSVGVVLINAAINFLLSPFIVEHLGISANGYITLANNFVSYIALITIALNSMSGRFILVEYRQGNMRGANEYYSSVLFGDWILSIVIIPLMVLFVVYIDRIINIDSGGIADTRILFSIVFVNYIIQLCLPQWQTAPYCTNNLYLRSLRNIVSSIVRALTIFLLFKFLKAHSYYVAVAATVMSVVSISMDYWFYRLLMPNLTIRFKYFSWQKVKDLVSSGMWNTVSQCGNLLLEGLDILITNIFINPISAGIMAVSKILPNMINQLAGTMGTTFGPRLTYLFADGNRYGMAVEIKNNIKVISILVNVPIGIFAVFGQKFFSLWLPGEDSGRLWLLSNLALSGIVFTGLGQCMINVFGAVNRLKWNSLVIIISGVISAVCVFLSLHYTNYGIYGIAGISAVISILRTLLFTAPYSAYCIGVPLSTFILPVLLGAVNVMLPILISLPIVMFISIESWWALLTAGIAVAFLSYTLDFILLLNKSQQVSFLKLLKIKK